jgi:hypothetical protein
MDSLRKFFDWQTCRDTAALTFLVCFIAAVREHDLVLYGIGSFSFLVTVYIQHRWDYREYVYGRAIEEAESRIDLENTLVRIKKERKTKERWERLCRSSGSGFWVPFAWRKISR